MYHAREMVMEECEVCGTSMQHRSLKRHVANQHAEVLNFAPPSLYSPSPARSGPRHFNVIWTQDDEMVDCPVPLCGKVCPYRDNMRCHFSFRHYDQGLSFNGDTTSYEKCELCRKYTRPARLAEHQESQFCRTGNGRRQTRAMVPTFYVGDEALERVTKFRYLGRILSHHDLSACVRNIQRAKAKWAAVSNVRNETTSGLDLILFFIHSSKPPRQQNDNSDNEHGHGHDTRRTTTTYFTSYRTVPTPQTEFTSLTRQA
jgi:hypothetical protein